jgi:hypothetical protein
MRSTADRGRAGQQQRIFPNTHTDADADADSDSNSDSDSDSDSNSDTDTDSNTYPDSDADPGRRRLHTWFLEEQRCQLGCRRLAGPTKHAIKLGVHYSRVSK